MRDRICENCKRSVYSEMRSGILGGPFLFCSPMCRDTSEKLRDYWRAKADQKSCATTCEVDGCHVCSGAMRERAGRGDR